MSKIVALSERHCLIINELLNRVAPCTTNCDASYAEYDEIRRATAPTTHTHEHVERNLRVRFIADVAEVGCDRPMALFEGPCGETYVRAREAFTERYKPLS